jgi:hypothetical protein
MFTGLNKLFGQKAPHKGGPMMREPAPSTPALQAQSQDRALVYSKVFRWRLPDGQTQGPVSVEVVGSFTRWQKVPLMRDSVLDAWHVTLHHIPGNKTHHYMLLVNGKPAWDKDCDGLAVPHGPQEEQYQLETDKGPRVFMLFGQTK